jgi:hypothetical protein
MYRSSPGKNRHFNYAWADIPGTMPDRPRHVFGTETPRYPELYITDIPYPAVTYDLGQRHERSYNSSFFFKVCIYKEKDVPRALTDSDLDFAKPLACFNWSNSYIWDASRHTFVSSPKVASICKDAQAVLTADMMSLPPAQDESGKKKTHEETPHKPGSKR